MSRHKKNNLIIIGLLAIVAVMAIGYAAFSSQLKINGTSNITSNFAVLITGIDTQDIVGGATNKSAPTFTNTTATFNTELVSPGDSITYKITVANQGTLDATLSSINIENGNNDAIVFETSGIEEGDNLLKSTADELFVKVTYNSNVTSQPENTNSQITVTLNYEQATGGSLPEEPESGTAGSDLVEMAGVVTSGNGLYKDSYETNQYVYRGSSPNNYITYNGETAGWRIISINTETNQIKIIRNAVLSDRAYDTTSGRYQGSSGYCNNSSYGCNIWGSSSTLYNASGSPITSLARQVGSTSYTLPTAVSDLNTYLNETYLNSTLGETARNQIEEGWFNVGGINYQNSNMTTDITQSKTARWKGNIGLIEATEYVKASTNSVCDSVYDFYNNISCYNSPSNYLNISDIFWTLSPRSYSNSRYVFGVYSGGNLSNSDASRSRGVRPVLYLSSDIRITGGTGTSSNPYTIS